MTDLSIQRGARGRTMPYMDEEWYEVLRAEGGWSLKGWVTSRRRQLAPLLSVLLCRHSF